MKTVVIAGAGPAGLTAAYELLKVGGFNVIILEKSGDIGGISKTVNYKGNRIDIGGHRFFSKSDVVMNWWADIMPIQNTGTSGAKSFEISYEGKKRVVASAVTGADADPETTDLVMLARSRLSRIFYLKRFFKYPLAISVETIQNLGLVRMTKIGMSYVWAMAFPIKPEKTLEDFFINRFGKVLYGTFFKDYTEKVWGAACKDIPADWGAQRVKGLSIGKAIRHFAMSKARSKSKNDLSQKGTETSLIERFLYPKFGPGQLWEEVARRVTEKGATLCMHTNVTGLTLDARGKNLVGVSAVSGDGKVHQFPCDYFISTMPVSELIAALGKKVPKRVSEVARGLKYRDFITVGVLLKRMSRSIDASGLAPDNWIYIQEPYVKVGRIQIFNNWSPYMVKDKNTIWIGMEYFANQGDEMWSLSDGDMKSLAAKELADLGFAGPDDILDSTVIRMEKAYPAYFGSYKDFSIIQAYTDSIPNMFLVGRNGMHKYNNQDHSMLTAMEAVATITGSKKGKAHIWSVNTEQEYHEKKDAKDLLVK